MNKTIRRNIYLMMFQIVANRTHRFACPIYSILIPDHLKFPIRFSLVIYLTEKLTHYAL